MLSRAGRTRMLRAPIASVSPATQLASSALSAPCSQQTVRHASAKAIRSRMEAVTTISKVTTAMKTVASARVKMYEKQMNLVRNFSRGIFDLWGPDTRIITDENDPNYVAPAAASAAASSTTPVVAEEGARPVIPNSTLIVTLTPDRGLCGSVSSATNRAARVRTYELMREKKPLMIMPVGEKNRVAFEKLFISDFVVSVSDHSKLKARTFKQSCLVADHILAQPFEVCELFYPKFKNMVTFDREHIKLPSLKEATHENKLFEPFELEGNNDLLANLYDFTTAVKIHTYLTETDMVEVSQRVNAMGNSSKAAGDMLAKLKLVYNRTRQNKITTELCEIISGAVSLDDVEA